MTSPQIYIVLSTTSLPPSQLCQVLQSVSSERAAFDKLEAERDALKQDLEVQLKVNAELKKLLVASVGEDLSQRVERLARSVC